MSLMVNCWNCGEEFEVSTNDIRPFVYHSCKDKNTGELFSYGMLNPNLTKKRPTYYKNIPVFIPKDHLLREYYGYGPSH